MKFQSRHILAVLFTGLWINTSEFFRNELLLKSAWVEHYQSIGMVFPSAPLNAAVWVGWGFLLSIAIYVISRKFSIVQTALIVWFMGFVLMWIAVWNLNVLSWAILRYAIPLSLVEVFVGSYICAVFAKPRPQPRVQST